MRASVMLAVPKRTRTGDGSGTQLLTAMGSQFSGARLPRSAMDSHALSINFIPMKLFQWLYSIPGTLRRIRGCEGEAAMNFEQLLKFGVDQGASAIHLQAEATPQVRIGGLIRNVEGPR